MEKNRSRFFKNQALLTINLVPTPEYTEMALIKILEATGKHEYVLVHDANEPSHIAEALEGKVKGMNLLFISPVESVTYAVNELIEAGPRGAIGCTVMGPGCKNKWTPPQWPVLQGKGVWQPDSVVNGLREAVAKATMGHAAIAELLERLIDKKNEEEEQENPALPELPERIWPSFFGATIDAGDRKRKDRVTVRSWA